MDDLSRYAQRPLGFYLRYVRLRSYFHVGIRLAGFVAAICSVGTQYGLKLPIDAFSGGGGSYGKEWFAFRRLIDRELSRLPRRALAGAVE